MESVLVLLPPGVKSIVYTAAYRHLSGSLLDRHLLSAETTQVNVQGCELLLVDLNFLSSAATQDGVDASIFDPVTQTLQLVVLDKVSEYTMLVQGGKVAIEAGARWARVDPKKLLMLLDKFIKTAGPRRTGGTQAQAETAELTKRQREKEMLARAIALTNTSIARP